jgi:Mn2+/Fe2+ NRAMP family transporter
MPEKVMTEEATVVPPGTTVPPPTTLGRTLRRIGPGLILAGAVVGSGELIATTLVGASVGFWLLWLILLGCTLKVFTQVEMGRYTLTWGKTALEALDELPGPRYRVNWVLWFWFAVVLLIVSQNGGIVGGVGEALAISQPLTAEGAAYNRLADALVRAKVDLALGTSGLAPALLEANVAQLTAQLAATPEPVDIVLWTVIIALGTAVLMWFSRYQFVQAVSTILVGAFTLVTFYTVFALQSTEWAVRWSDVLDGFRFRLPPEGTTAGGDGLGAALAAFGMIGLAAGELIMYPYWCLEKGYARFTGPRAPTPEWAARARGWLRVLRYDAWLSMVVYTFATIGFYVLGATVLHRSGLRPDGQAFIRTLSEMYVPVFGPWAEALFLVGAFAVLYSTYFVFAAGFARMIADALVLLGLIDGGAESREKWIRILSVVLPLLALVAYLFVRAPVAMVLAAGLGQAAILPVLGGAALYFRYKRLDARLRPGLWWDVFLWLAALGLLVIGLWSVYNRVA